MSDSQEQEKDGRRRTVDREDDHRERSLDEQLHNMLAEHGIDTEIIAVPENESFLPLFPQRQTQNKLRILEPQK